MKSTSKLAVTLSVLLASSGAMAADWASNSMGYRYAPSGSEPGVSDKVSKNIATFTHVSGDSLGSNFFTIDLLKSASTDPAAGTGNTKGAQDYKKQIRQQFPDSHESREPHADAQPSLQ